MTELDEKDSGLNYLQIDSHFLARSSGWKLVGSSCGDNIHNIHIMFPQKSPLIYIFMVHVVLHGTLLKIFLKIRHFFFLFAQNFFSKCAKCIKKEKYIYSITKPKASDLLAEFSTHHVCTR